MWTWKKCCRRLGSSQLLLNKVENLAIFRVNAAPYERVQRQYVMQTQADVEAACTQGDQAQPG